MSDFDPDAIDEYPPGRTVHGGKCPGDAPMGSECPYGTEHVSLVSYVTLSDPAHPKLQYAHTVAVCHEHYAAQYRAKYGWEWDEVGPSGTSSSGQEARELAPR